MITKIIFSFAVLLIILPVVSASGCFLYPESSYYCKDISESLAKEECDLQGCDIRLFFKSTSCANLPVSETCSKVLCKSTCSFMSARDCKAGVVPFGFENEWCGKGCCKYGSGSDTACFSSPSRYFCEMNAKTSGVSAYSFLVTNTSCTLECNRGLDGAVAGTVKLSGNMSSASSTASRDLGSRANNGLDTGNDVDSNSDSSGAGSYILLFVLILVIVAVFVFVSLKAKNRMSSRDDYRKKRKSVDSLDDTSNDSSNDTLNDDKMDSNNFGSDSDDSDMLGPKPVLTSDFSSDLSRRINEEGEGAHNSSAGSSRHSVSHKSHQASRLHTFEEFSHHGGSISKKSTFDKLSSIADTKKTALEKLERFESKDIGNIGERKSAFNKAKKKKIENVPVKKERASLEELRKMANSKK